MVGFCKGSEPRLGGYYIPHLSLRGLSDCRIVGLSDCRVVGCRNVELFDVRLSVFGLLGCQSVPSFRPTHTPHSATSVTGGPRRLGLAFSGKTLLTWRASGCYRTSANCSTGVLRGGLKKIKLQVIFEYRPFRSYFLVEHFTFSLKHPERILSFQRCEFLFLFLCDNELIYCQVGIFLGSRFLS